MIMSEANGFEELKYLFSTASTLPQLPGAALRLIQILDDEEVNSSEVERIIMGDPALTAAVIRAASSAIYGASDEGTTTVRGAITRLGHRAVQSVAVSLGVQALMGQTGASSSFDRTRFARHSLFVGFLSRYLYACRAHKEPFKSKWSRDEIFAAGVLHDLALGLLARVDPATFEKVAHIAKKTNLHYETAFHALFHADLIELGVLACKTWGLPPLFSDVLEQFAHPSQSEHEKIALSCVAYANRLADENNYGLEAWPTPNLLTEEDIDEVILPEEDVPGVVMLVARHTAAYVPLAGAA